MLSRAGSGAGRRALMDGLATRYKNLNPRMHKLNAGLAHKFILRFPVVLENVQRMELVTYRKYGGSSGTRLFLHNCVPAIRWHNEDLKVKILSAKEDKDPYIKIVTKDGKEHKTNTWGMDHKQILDIVRNVNEAAGSA